MIIGSLLNIGEESNVVLKFSPIHSRYQRYWYKRLEDGLTLRAKRRMRQRELLEFRTPQHPSLGTNKWGGASPLLARDIPKESLEQRYIKLNSIRTRDEILPTDDDHFNYISQTHASKHEQTPTSRRSSGFLSKLMLPRKETATLGTNSNRKRWFPRWDPKNRWPQGWC